MNKTKESEIQKWIFINFSDSTEGMAGQKLETFLNKNNITEFKVLYVTSTYIEIIYMSPYEQNNKS